MTLLLDDDELDLSMREADVAIRLRQPTQPDLIQRKLFTVHFHAYASPDYIKTLRHAANRSRNSTSTRSSPSARPRSYLHEPSTGWSEAGRPEGDPRPVALRVNNAYGLAAPCRPASASPRWPTTSWPRNSGLVQIDLPVETPEFDTYFVYPEELKDTKRVTVFRDFIVAKAKEWSF